MAGKGLLIWILDVCLDSAACSSYRAKPVRADHLLVSAHSDVYEDYVLCMIGLFINSMPLLVIWAGHARVPVPLAPIDITLLKSYFLPSQLETTCTVFPIVILEEDVEDVIFMVLYSDEMRHA